MTYYSYVNEGINTFENVIKAFTLYENGGFWVKKIDKQASFIREIVMGPYTLEKAKELSQLWRPNVNSEKLQGVETSKYFSFCELVCNNDDREYYQKIRNFIHDEYIWKPPLGINLFCLMKRYLDVALYKKKDISDPNFVKFQKFAELNGINKLVVGDNIIFYLISNYKGYNRALNLRKFLLKYSDNYSPEEQIYLVNKISGNKTELGVKPDNIPEYLILDNNYCNPISIYFFKEFLELKNKNKFLSCFKKLEKCLTPECISLGSSKDDKLSTTLTVKFITSDKDYRPKILYFTKLSKNKFTLRLGNCTGDYFVELKEDEISFILPSTRSEWRKFVISSFNDDIFFDSIEKTLSLMLYICKCLGKSNLYIRDDRIVTCECKKSYSPIYINPIRFIVGLKNIYHDLGFKDNDTKKIKEVVNKYKNIKLKNFLNIEEDLKNILQDEAIFLDKTIFELSEMFLKKTCIYEEMCDILSVVSLKIFNELYDCCSVFETNLNNKDLGFYRKFF